METPSFGLDQIGQIAVNTKDAERARAFYRDALGMKMLFAAGNLSFFAAGSLMLMLSPAEESEFDHPSSILYFNVADIDAAFAALGARGVGFRDSPHVVHRAPDHDLWMTFFRDSEGNTLALQSRRPRAS